MRSKPLNFTALAFYLRNSHPLDFLTLFGKDFASLVMLRGGTSHMSAFGGKADMTFCHANVCL
jgi:hypothetical protein